MSVDRIRFKGETYVLVAGGAIATEDDYRHGRPSFAHLGGDGMVRRFHQVIGDEDDIEIIEEDIESEPADDFIANILTHAGWNDDAGP